MPAGIDVGRLVPRLRWGLGALARTRSTHMRATSDIYGRGAELSARHPGLLDEGGDLNPRSLGVDALRAYELRVTSQNGEDGVLAEILARVGVGPRFVVEFGAGDGSETTTGFLTDWCGWSAVLIEIDGFEASRLARKHQHEPNVVTRQGQVTEDNLEPLLTGLGVPADLDVLSIDIDSVDYWIWRSIRVLRPRVVVIEYNSTLPAGRSITVPRDQASGVNPATDRYGASLDALVQLGASKGYVLVHTELAGVNAFFVRDDLAGAVRAGTARRAGPNHFLGSDGPLATYDGGE